MEPNKGPEHDAKASFRVSKPTYVRGIDIVEQLSLTQMEIANFATLCDNWNPLHHDENYALRTQFAGVIACGSHVTSLMMGLPTWGCPEFVEEGKRQMTTADPARIQCGDLAHPATDAAAQADSRPAWANLRAILCLASLTV